MVFRWKENQARSKRMREMLKEDRISQLPDALICHILSHLPVKDSVKTSVLSTRWTSLWLWAPCLELGSRSFPDFNALKSFGDRFFDSNRVSYINKVKLYLDEMEDVVDDDTSNLITSWIDAAVKRKIQHLDLCCHVYMYPFAIPISTYTCEALVYTCEALVSLKLHLVAVANAEFVSLPCLKTLHLKSVSYPNEATFERLVSSCPVLEELEIATYVNFNPIVFRVLSRSLKKLKITIRNFGRDYCRGVVIDAPLLSSLSINDKLSNNFVIKKMHSNAKLDISIGFGLKIFKAFYSSEKNSIRSLLREISKVRDMTISTNTVEILCGYSKSKSLPRFGYNMSRLHVTLFYTYLKWLPTFLKSFPHLKSLILVCNGEYKTRPLVGTNPISYSSVPDCLRSSLEFVDLEFPVGGYDAELKLAKYLLDNSATLKKLILRLENLSIRERSNFKKELLRVPRDSTQCEVVVLDLLK